ncbi:hypothetical protein F5Y16DRAFT_386039 [Xylariaceae sp. FL0255]|nr:hypothetical protein F5Y16DRAFT_386039 [Xylariaceae sp. FL0255]
MQHSQFFLMMFLAIVSEGHTYMQAHLKGTLPTLVLSRLILLMACVGVLAYVGAFEVTEGFESEAIVGVTLE